MRTTFLVRCVALVLGVVAFAANSAHAGLLPVNVTVTPEAGNYRWTYAVVLPTDMKLQSGNFFTIYDFAGLVPGSEMMPEGWTTRMTMTGPTPDRLNPKDDATIANLTFTYTGPTIPSGQIGLGNFSAASTFENSGSSYLTARTNRTSDGLIDSNITDTLVPTGAGPVTPPPGVPEPATLALAGLGLPVIGAVHWLRRTKK